MFTMDAQQALGFLVSQTAYIEPQVVEIQYPDIQYPDLIPVDTSADEWAKSITYYSMNKVGQAGWFSAWSKDMHVADVERTKFEVGVEMADIGYRYNLEELGVAMRIPGMNLSAERAAAARRAYEEFVDAAALLGNTEKNFSGLLNYPGVTRIDAANIGTDGFSHWASKNVDQIMADINDALTGIYTGTATVEMADTVLLPIAAMTLLANKRIDNTAESLLSYLSKYNTYSHVTGSPLMIRGVRGLETAGTNGTGRMIVYRRDPQVLKLHIPMTHRFLPVWQTGPMIFDIPGVFRFAGLEIRRPGAVRYVDGILEPAYE